MHNDCWANPSTPVHQFKGYIARGKDFFLFKLHKKCESTLTREHSGRLTIGYKHMSKPMWLEPTTDYWVHNMLVFTYKPRNIMWKPPHTSVKILHWKSRTLNAPHHGALTRSWRAAPQIQYLSRDCTSLGVPWPPGEYTDEAGIRPWLEAGPGCCLFCKVEEASSYLHKEL